MALVFGVRNGRLDLSLVLVLSLSASVSLFLLPSLG
jgi:hypothetical protein